MWWTALIMGLAGSLHCAGMCSPLAMAVTARSPFLFNKVLYNVGRILTYSFMGAVAAMFGSMIVIAPYQKVVSFVIGSLFLLMGIGAISGIRIPYVTTALTKLTNYLKKLFHFLLVKKGKMSVFIMGMLNGLLPCGLTYLAISYCFIMPSVIDGFLFMILFGVGTWPVMIGFTWLLAKGFGKLRLNFQRITTVVFILIGVWLLARITIIESIENHGELVGKTTSEEVICP